MKKVVIIGAGFGGINCAKELSKDPLLEITLIDRNNYHLFQPLLYQVATAGLSPAEIASPIRSIFSKKSQVKVILDEVTDIDRKNKKVITKSGNLNYDYLVVACGSTHSYFQNPEWEEHAPGLKTLEQATEIRRRILVAFENAEKEIDPGETQKYLTFVIVGAGPTGVELAGSISEIARQTLDEDFRHIDPSKTKIILIEAGPRILNMFDEKLSEKAMEDLKKMGVEVRLNLRVKKVSNEGVETELEKINANTVIWAAGVKPSPLGAKLNTPLDSSGRVVVNQDLSIIEDPDIFCIGDMARFDQNGAALPGLAPVAMQQGRYVAKIILNDKNERPRKKFVYFDKGAMATIGRSKAVLQFGNIKISGFIAWLSWLFIHIYYLIGFRNRTIVFFQWAWSYFTLQRGARLIIDKDWRLKK